jgi:hypothetical protein
MARIVLFAAALQVLLGMNIALASELKIGSCSDGECPLLHSGSGNPMKDANSRSLSVDRSKRSEARKHYKIIEKADAILRKRGFSRAARIEIVSSFRNEGSKPGAQTPDVVNAYVQQTYGTKVSVGAWDSDQRPISILREFPSYRFEGVFDVRTGRELKLANILTRVKSIPSCYANGNPLRDCRPLRYSPVSGCRLGKKGRQLLGSDVGFWKVGILGDAIVLPSKTIKSRLKLGTSNAQQTKASSGKNASNKKLRRREYELVKVCPNNPWEYRYERVATIQTGSTSTRQTKKLQSIASLSGISGFQLRDSFDLIGGDLSSIKGLKSAKACAQRCSKASGCAGFTYDKWNKWCFLKTSAAELRLEPKTVSGIRTSVSMPGRSGANMIVKHYRGKTFPYKGYKTAERKSFDSCKSWCLEEGKCVAYSFEKSSRSCRLLDTAGEYFSDAGVDSGVKRQAAK